MMTIRPATAFLVAAGCFALSACYYPPPQVAMLGPVPEPVANYGVGETRTATTGSIMLDRSDGSQVLPGFVLTQPLEIIGVKQQPPVNAALWAARFQYRGTCPEGYYVLTSPSFYQDRIGIVVAEDGSIACDPAVVQLIGGKRGRTWQIAEALPVHPFTPVPYIAGFSADAVRWQLLYGGRDGNKITINHREFRGGAFEDNAAPAFQQQLTYNLGKDKTITFRDTQILVLGATNREISFRVLRDPKRALRMPPPMDTTGDAGGQPQQ